MGDSDAVVTQSPPTVSYTSMGYPCSDHVDANPNFVVDADVAGAGPNADDTFSAPADAAQTASHDAAEDSLADSAKKEASNTTEDETLGSVGGADNNLIIAGAESTSMELSRIANYDSNANGNVVDDVKTFSGASGGENGNISSDVHGTTAEQQFADGVVLSAEEERLWSIIRANSLDFSTWTSLIEETERTTEDNIAKIRKVYDAFLAEFPLCYGYWKKYADHELRMGDIGKVVEVYERAVQGVTYSVEIWLHYCVFAISTYGDPDTIRSKPLHVWRKGLVELDVRFCIFDVQIFGFLNFLLGFILLWLEYPSLYFISHKKLPSPYNSP